MRILINSFLFRWFRRSFLKAIYKDINSGNNQFCCHVKSWHSKLICWKELREVQDELESTTLLCEDLRYIKDYGCRCWWFNSSQDRLQFIQDCINRLN